MNILSTVLRIFIELWAICVIINAVILFSGAIKYKKFAEGGMIYLIILVTSTLVVSLFGPLLMWVFLRKNVNSNEKNSH